MRHLPKSQAQAQHAKRRAAERLGISLSDADLNALVIGIQNNEYRFVKRTSQRATVFEATINGRLVHLVYDSDRKTIATVLDPTVPRLPRIRWTR